MSLFSFFSRGSQFSLVRRQVRWASGIGQSMFSTSVRHGIVRSNQIEFKPTTKLLIDAKHSSFPNRHTQKPWHFYNQPHRHMSTVAQANASLSQTNELQKLIKKLQAWLFELEHNESSLKFSESTHALIPSLTTNVKRKINLVNPLITLLSQLHTAIYVEHDQASASKTNREITDLFKTIQGNNDKELIDCFNPIMQDVNATRSDITVKVKPVNTPRPNMSSRS